MTQSEKSYTEQWKGLSTVAFLGNKDTRVNSSFNSKKSNCKLKEFILKDTLVFICLKIFHTNFFLHFISLHLFSLASLFLHFCWCFHLFVHSTLSKCSMFLVGKRHYQFQNLCTKPENLSSSICISEISSLSSLTHTKFVFFFSPK